MSVTFLIGKLILMNTYFFINAVHCTYMHKDSTYKTTEVYHFDTIGLCSKYVFSINLHTNRTQEY